MIYRDSIRIYGRDFILLVASITLPLVSGIVDLLLHPEVSWFQRSGSLMVLFAVILEQRQEATVKPKPSLGYKVAGKPILEAVEMSEPRKRLKMLSIYLIVIGTVIWGYGDLLMAGY